MGIKRLSNRPRTELSQEQKVAFALLAFLGLGGLIFGFRSFGANLNRPIQQQIVDHFTGEEYLSAEQKLTKQRENQRKLDTDIDGLSDYDELYVYRSSPYLQDTDSDGLDDRTEVFAAQDPNCPEGKTCGPEQQGEDVASKSQTDLEGLLKVFEDSDAAIKAGSVPLNSKEDIEGYFQGISVDQLRQALLRTGIPQSQLDLIDDETLQNYFAGAMTDLKTKEAEVVVAKEANDGQTTETIAP